MEIIGKWSPESIINLVDVRNVCVFSVESGNLSIGNIHWYTGLYLILYTLCIRRQFFLYIEPSCGASVLPRMLNRYYVCKKKNVHLSDVTFSYTVSVNTNVCIKFSFYIKHRLNSLSAVNESWSQTATKTLNHWAVCFSCSANKPHSQHHLQLCWQLVTWIIKYFMLQGRIKADTPNLKTSVTLVYHLYKCEMTLTKMFNVFLP